MLNFLSVCALYTDAIPPPQQSRMGGGLSFLYKTSDSHLLQRGGEEKKMNEEVFLKPSACSRDKRWSGSRQTAVLFHASCCLVDGLCDPEKVGSVCCGCDPQV